VTDTVAATEAAEAKTPATRLTVVDLFAGAGGATQGLKDAGFAVLAAVEWDSAAAATYRANHPTVDLTEGDISGVDPDALRRRLRLERGELTVLKGCPPCQGYSSIGSGDPADPRNDLVSEVWRFAQSFLPEVVLLENVPGLARDGRLDKLLRQLRAVGYSAKTYIVDATQFGVPQRRRRLIVVAVRGGTRTLPDSLTDLLPDWFAAAGLRTAGEALASVADVDPGLDALHRPRQPSSVVAARLAALPVGGTRFDLPDEHRLACHGRLERRDATVSYSRIVADRPAPTMTTRCTTPACGRFVHPTEARAITLREAAAIQTFPLTYTFDGGVGQIERQIGNAVPVRMAHGLGLCARAILV
jgi:DNA (cytosine-5)-methyltransferase 1